MQPLDSYRGKRKGDVVKVNSTAHPTKKLAKIVGIYKTKNGVRFMVKIAGGIKLDIHVIFDTDPEPCDCDISVLMKTGCLCGGL